jgi:hypothetical protein
MPGRRSSGPIQPRPRSGLWPCLLPQTTTAGVVSCGRLPACKPNRCERLGRRSPHRLPPEPPPPAGRPSDAPSDDPHPPSILTIASLAAIGPPEKPARDAWGIGGPGVLGAHSTSAWRSAFVEIDCRAIWPKGRNNCAARAAGEPVDLCFSASSWSPPERNRCVVVGGWQ